MVKSTIVSAIILLFVGCSDLPCMKSYQLHLKANLSQSQVEKEYYEKQAEIYDKQCANYNAGEYKKRQEEESRKQR
jgi:hypothetical protein